MRAPALALCAVLAGCAAPVPSRIDPERISRVDPERVVAPESPVLASQSCTLTRRASVPVSLPGIPLVAAEINGRPATLILDTGAEYSVLTGAAARRLGVTTRYDFARTMGGIGREMRTGDAKLDSFRLGGVLLRDPRILVGDVVLHIGASDPDGLLGASVLGDFDLDIDLPRRRLTLYDRVDCARLQPPWTGRYATLEMTRSLSGHPFFPVTINGHTLSATLDTGAQRTVLAARAAPGAGVGADSQLATRELRTQGAAGEIVPASLHLVREFRVGGEPIRTPILVAPAALPRDIDALLGLDFLMTHRVWLSYGSRRMFLAAG